MRWTSSSVFSGATGRPFTPIRAAGLVTSRRTTCWRDDLLEEARGRRQSRHDLRLPGRHAGKPAQPRDPIPAGFTQTATPPASPSP